MTTIRSLLASIALALVPAAHAQDRADIDGTKIIGNRELPKVLYIVPWKKPLQGDLSGKPPASVLDEVLAPVDRDVFRRQVQYDTQLRDTQIRADAAKASATMPPAATTTRP